MIADGTTDQLKESILGNVCWRPDEDDVYEVTKAFEAEDLKVSSCFVMHNRTLGKYTSELFCTVMVYCETRRGHEGAVAKILRATRRARVALYRYDNQTPGASRAATKVYRVEVRGHD